MSQNNNSASAREQFRSSLENSLVRKFFYIPAFEIYGGVGGLYDYGPTGCALKSNFLEVWRRHFVLEEDMLEISSTVLTPHVVLKTSGHVDRFSDFIVRDVKTGDSHRADKLLEARVEELLERSEKAKALVKEGKDLDAHNKALTDKFKKSKKNKGKEVPVLEVLSDEQEAELKQIHSYADAYTQEQLGKKLKELKIVSPGTGNALSDPIPFNLMFGTQIGPTGKFQGYLRPETAQGIFVNFRRLLEYNNGRMPFAAAQIGLAFRNEIAPRGGLIRVREFQMAEIEHFVDPQAKDHPRFKEVAHLELNLLGNKEQDGSIDYKARTIGDAVESGLVDNQTLGYFLARTQLFMHKIGITPEKLRFRQHKDTEMAHYAADCWDAEIHTTYGWVECVGHADRAAFDLKVHTAKSGVQLVAEEKYQEPKVMRTPAVELNKRAIGKAFRKNAQVVMGFFKELVENRDCEQAAAVEKALADNGEYDVKVSCKDSTFTVTREMVPKIEFKDVVEHVRKYTPNVIEPSFGIGRILYALLEHSYFEREESKANKSESKEPKSGGNVVRAVLRLKPCVAPVKVGVLSVAPPKNADDVHTFIKQLKKLGLACSSDPSTVSIGRRYARMDEIGVPFVMTFDTDNFEKGLITVRERDSTAQVLIPLEKAVSEVARLVSGELDWEKDVYDKLYPAFSSN